MLVHDAARPLLPEEVIERVLAPLSEGWDGVVPGLPVADTVKRVDGERRRRDAAARRASSPCRRRRRSSPPSCARPLAAGGDAGDCASLVEAAGGRVKVVAGDPRLLKVTTPEDLERVASWLA